MRALLVANPLAGRVRSPEGVVRVVHALQRAGLEVDLLCPERPHEPGEEVGRALAGCDPADTRVVVAGGDGSIHRVLSAVMNTPFPLAILPVGSVNVLARELGIPLSLEAAAQVAATGATRRMDLGLANGRPFATTFGVGFDAAVVGAVQPGPKRLLGSALYVAQGLAILARYRGAHFRITADQETVEGHAWLAIVANHPRYTYRVRICPEAALNDGWLDVCLFRGNSFFRKSSQVIAALLNRHTGRPGVQHMRARRFRFECDPPLPVQLDGDEAGTTPVEVVVAPGALSIVVPR